MSESALQGKAAQVTRGVGKLGKEVARMCQKGDFQREDVPFEHHVLRLRFNSTSSQIFGLLNALTAAHKRLQQHLGRLAASCLRLKSWLWSLHSGFLNRVAWLVIAEAASHRANLTSVASLPAEGFEWNFSSIMEILRRDERGVNCQPPARIHQKRILACLWSIVTIDMRVTMCARCEQVLSLAFRH